LKSMGTDIRPIAELLAYRTERTSTGWATV
jgi:hypothetical protein